MKLKKMSMLFVTGFAAFALASCDLVAGLRTAKSWLKENVYEKAMDLIDGQPAEEDQQKPAEEEQQKPDEGGETQVDTYYTIKFLNGEEVLQSSQVKEGDLPEYKGEVPAKESTAQYSFSFQGWDKEIVAATADATYVATFKEEVRTYTIRFTNENEILQSEELEYGAMPEYKGAEPTKPSDAQYSYKFTGWDHEIAVVTGDANYNAKFEALVNNYTIRFESENEVLQESLVAYGEMPAYNGETPTKESTAQYDFEFDGWTPELAVVTGNATYKAHFAEILKQYKVTFNTNGGSEIDPVMVNYGECVAQPADPSKAQTETSIFFFEGWDYDFSTPITGELVINALWDEVSATEHAHRCSYTHYAAQDPDYINPGHIEFWMCELHHSYVLSEPTTGTVNEATAPYAEAIAADDARYIAPLEGGNYFARINVGPSNCPSSALPAFRTENSLNNVVGYKLRYRISGAFAEGKSSWMGFFVGSETSDVYSVYDSNCGGKAVGLYDFDGQWHELTVRFASPLSGYFAFGHALTDFAEGTFVDVDDLVIYADEVLIEEFARTPSTKLISSEFVMPGGEAKQATPENVNNFMRIHLVSGIDYSFAYSFKSYTNITNISFKFRLNKEGGIKDGSSSAWFGVKTASSNQKLSSYQEGSKLWHVKTANTGNSDSYFNGLWQNYEINGLNEEGYIAFVSCADFKNGTFLDIDDVTIVSNGVTYNESFDSIAPLFGASSKEDYQPHLSFEYEEIISTDKAFDPLKGELFIYNYAAKNTLVTENITDPEKGSCVRIKEWRGHDNVWLAFPQTATHDELVRGLNGEEPTEFYFSVYNSGSSNISLQLRYGKDDWVNKPSTTFKAGQWTDIVLPIDENVTDVSKISYYRWVGGDENNQTVICDENTQLTFTAIYVRHNDVNPAPFGVVALNADTGSFRDIKGYTPTHNDSHGIDETYGSYIQIDDWACASGRNRCWLTFSDTARSTSEIEAELGTSISAFFFYIYNPLQESFTFNVMLKSSSGMNPNVNVACAAGQWTKVSLAYNHADNGSYPALTSASQIGLDHTFGSNGSVVGSGWKITSVYAE